MNIEQLARERYPYISERIPERVRTLELRTAFISGYKAASEWKELKQDNLPKMLVVDMFTGGTPVLITDGENVGTSRVGDHDVWYYEMKEMGITHWREMLPLPSPQTTSNE